MERNVESAWDKRPTFLSGNLLHATDRTLVCMGCIAFLSLQIKPKIVVYTMADCI